MLQGTVQFLTWLRLKGAWGRPSAAGEPGGGFQDSCGGPRGGGWGGLTLPRQRCASLDARQPRAGQEKTGQRRERPGCDPHCDPQAGTRGQTSLWGRFP